MDVFVCGTRYPYHLVIHTLPYLSALHRESRFFFPLRHYQTAASLLLFLHLPICHLLFFALSWTFLPICLPFASVTVMCSLYGSITFLAYLFDLWMWVWNCIWLHEVDKSHLKVQVCETVVFMCWTQRFWPLHLMQWLVALLWCRFSCCCCLWGDHMSSKYFKGKRCLLF